jgi:hypothetical protein
MNTSMQKKDQTMDEFDQFVLYGELEKQTQVKCFFYNTMELFHFYLDFFPSSLV